MTTKTYAELTDAQREQVTFIFNPMIAGDPKKFVYELGTDDTVLCRRSAKLSSKIPEIPAWNIKDKAF